LTSQNKTLSPILIGTWHGHGDHLIGVLELNRPDALNALNLKMITLLQAALLRWQEDERVVCIVLIAAGERAFCVGGDVKSLYASTPVYNESWNRSDVNNAAVEFFIREYHLDRLIHRYPKPIVVMGQGIIMGGGLGLLANASHRVVAESAQLAMPEVNLGFIPDVASSWFLNRTPSNSGEFMALTGVSVNAADAIAMGLADYCVLRAGWKALQVAFKHCHWSDDREEIFSQVSVLLKGRSLLNDRQLQPPQMLKHLSDIEPWFHEYQGGEGQGEALISRICAYRGESVLLQQARTNLNTGCKVSMLLALQLMLKTRGLSFQQCQQLELNVAINLIAAGHFHEGVRALLVDKDRQPQWQNTALGGRELEQFFASPWVGRTGVSGAGKSVGRWHPLS